MNDAENLTKLLSHLPPETFHNFITNEIGILLAPLDPKESKKKQRKAMEDALSAIDVTRRQKIEEIAERIVLLTDGAGQDVIEGFSGNIFDESDREDFAALRSGSLAIVRTASSSSDFCWECSFFTARSNVRVTSSRISRTYIRRQAPLDQRPRCRESC